VTIKCSIIIFSVDEYDVRTKGTNSKTLCWKESICGTKPNLPHVSTQRDSMLVGTKTITFRVNVYCELLIHIRVYLSYK